MDILYPTWFCSLSLGLPISVFRTHIMKQWRNSGIVRAPQEIIPISACNEIFKELLRRFQISILAANNFLSLNYLYFTQFRTIQCLHYNFIALELRCRRGWLRSISLPLLCGSRQYCSLNYIFLLFAWPG